MSLVRADALSLPLADESVDLVVTSPPYFALRSYTDGGEHYDGQIGSEDTPRAFLEALWAVTAECKRVLKPTGSMFVNLGDKYAGSGGHNNAGLSGRDVPPPPGKALGAGGHGATRRSAPDRYNQTADVPRKSLMGLPWLYALGCTGALRGIGVADPGLDLTLRAEIIGDDPDPHLDLLLQHEIVWSKPNGMPESVTDRVRRTHEQWFHLTKSPTYFADMDSLRGPHAETTVARAADHRAPTTGRRDCYPPGTRPQSIERIKSMHPKGALPGSVWSVSTEPLVVPEDLGVDHFAAFPTEWPRRFVNGWCPEGGIVLDPFGGSGTTAMVANALGRYGISVDLSADYLRLARWRIHESGHARKAIARTWQDRQGALL